MKPLPPHLVGMTRARWDAMTQAERDTAVDRSDLNLQLLPYLGQKVRVTPPRKFGRSTFRVGRTTGWRPVLLAVRAGARGSSNTIGVDEKFDTIALVR